MALYFRLTCGECDLPVRNDDKKKTYVHDDHNRHDHDVTEVISEDITGDRLCSA